MNMKKRILLAICLVCLTCGVVACFAIGKAQTPAVQTQPEVTPMPQKPAGAQVETKTSGRVAEVNLPADMTPRLTVKDVQVYGNTLIPARKLFRNMPKIYNASGKPLKEAPANSIYDLTVLRDIINNPGRPREVSTRSIQGLTQYVLSVYQNRHYAGIYVYIPAKSIEGGKLKDDILPIQVLEAKVSNVKVTYYDPNGVEAKKGHLRQSEIRAWSPIWAGQVTNKKNLDDYINLLNLNPDRRVYATIAPGTEPNSLAVRYDVYESNPWHYFIQLDNSGTEDRQWFPRLGVINTDLFGFDDKFTAVVQGPVHKDPTDDYAAYAAYDIPLFTPRLRLNLYAARSEFDVASVQGIDFLGKGYSYGGTLRYNAFQADEWFFDVLGSVRHERSEFTSSLASLFPGTGIGQAAVNIDLWGIGVDIHRSNDISDSSLTINHYQSMGGSDEADFAKARTGAEPDFGITTFSAAHHQYIDASKIQRVLGSFTYILPDARLAPVEMTTFGGLYTVRGYKESEIIADGGTLASVQYEYDLVKAAEIKDSKNQTAPTKKPWLRRLAPVGFFDFGRAVDKNPVPGEQGSQLLYSVGTGLLAEIGDNFSGGLYYGWPLKATQETDIGAGRFSINLMLRW